MKEFELIEYIKKKFPDARKRLMLPIGDDCSALMPPKGKIQVTTVDSLVDGNHFSSKYFSPGEIGRKVLRVNLSDLASMGAVGPYYAWLVFALPKGIKNKTIKGILDGFKGDCKKFGVTLAGGNITSAGCFSIHATLTGWAKPKKVLTRKGAKPGDTIFVTGKIGASTLAYRQFMSGRKPQNFLLKRWANPVPKLEIGRFLADNGIANSCIDISDGIFQDLRHITGASKVGAVVEWEQIPIAPQIRKMNPTPKMIGFGEDYELLFTVPQKKLKKLGAISGDIKTIGKITKSGFKVVDKRGKEIDITNVGYSHIK